MPWPAAAPATAPVLALALGFASCADLHPLTPNVCGNHVLEPDANPPESCDGEPGCGVPGTPQACRYTCGALYQDGCPKDSGYGCGLDGICRRPSGKFESMGSFSTPTALDLMVADVNLDGCSEVVHTTVQGTTVTAFASQVADTCPLSKQDLPTGLVPSKDDPAWPAPMLADVSGDGRLDLVVPGRGLYGGGLFVSLAKSDPAFLPLLFATDRLAETSSRLLRVTFQGEDALLVFTYGAPPAMGGSGGMGGMGGAPPSGGMGGGPPGGSGGMGGAPGGGTGVALVKDAKAKPAGTNMSVPFALDTFAFAQAADLFPENPSCDEVVVAAAGEKAIHVYRLCKDGSGPVFEEAMSDGGLPAVSVGAGAAIRSRNAVLAIHDLDKDGQLDLLFNATDQNLHVAYGAAGGTFHSAPPAPGQKGDGKASIYTPPGVDAATLAALVSYGSRFVAANLDESDDDLEFVALPCPAAEAFSSPVCAPVDATCEAVVADIDRDDHLDIVSTLSQEPGIIVRRGNGKGGFSTSSLSTQCPAHGLVATDIDGDGIGDIAFFDQEPSSETGQSTDTGSSAGSGGGAAGSGGGTMGSKSGGATGSGSGSAPDPTQAHGVSVLSISYGVAYATPAAPQVSGELDPGSGLVAGHFPPPKGGKIDAEGAQLWAARDRMGGGAELMLVEQHGTRRPAAPFYFPQGPSGSDNLLVVDLRAAVAGRFAKPAGSADSAFGLAVVTRDLALPADQEGMSGTERLFRLAGEAAGTNLQTLAQTKGSAPNGVAAHDCEACVLAAIDTDGDGLDEVLWLGDSGQAYVYGLSGDAFAERASFPIQHAFHAFDSAAYPRKYAPHPLVADADGDGQKDVIARAESGALVVFWGRGGGQFDEAELLACDGGATCVGYSAALLNADNRPDTEIFVFGPRVASLYELDRATRKLAPFVPDPASKVTGKDIAPPPPDSDFVAASAADLDGDGVDDLVLLGSSTFVNVLRGIPETQ